MRPATVIMLMVILWPVPSPLHAQSPATTSCASGSVSSSGYYHVGPSLHDLPIVLACDAPNRSTPGCEVIFEGDGPYHVKDEGFDQYYYRGRYSRTGLVCSLSPFSGFPSLPSSSSDLPANTCPDGEHVGLINNRPYCFTSPCPRGHRRSGSDCVPLCKYPAGYVFSISNLALGGVQPDTFCYLNCNTNRSPADDPSPYISAYRSTGVACYEEQVLAEQRALRQEQEIRAKEVNRPFSRRSFAPIFGGGTSGGSAGGGGGTSGGSAGGGSANTSTDQGADQGGEQGQGQGQGQDSAGERAGQGAREGEELANESDRGEGEDGDEGEDVPVPETPGEFELTDLTLPTVEDIAEGVTGGINTAPVSSAFKRFTDAITSALWVSPSSNTCPLLGHSFLGFAPADNWATVCGWLDFFRRLLDFFLGVITLIVCFSIVSRLKLSP